MFDDLRQQAVSGSEEEKPPKVETPAPKKAPVAAAPKPRKKSKVILGMTGPQRFAVSFLLMLMTCVTGFMFLLVMNKIAF